MYRVHHSPGNGLPLGAESDPEWFKLILLDVALCQSILGLDLSVWFINPIETFANRGEIVECFIGQEQLCYSMPFRKTELFFWKTEKISQAEVDYLNDYKGEVIPIEVKSGDGRTLKSMHRFLESHSSLYGVRFCSQNYSNYNQIDSRPLYAAVSLAHEEQKKSIQSLFV